VIKPPLSQAFVKAARMLLDWDQQKLANATGLSISTVGRFEAGAGVHDETMYAMVKAFEEAGLIFLYSQDGSCVIGIRFQDPQQDG